MINRKYISLGCPFSISPTQENNTTENLHLGTTKDRRTGSDHRKDLGARQWRDPRRKIRKKTRKEREREWQLELAQEEPVQARQPS